MLGTKPRLLLTNVLHCGRTGEAGTPLEPGRELDLDRGRVRAECKDSDEALALELPQAMVMEVSGRRTGVTLSTWQDSFVKPRENQEQLLRK